MCIFGHMLNQAAIIVRKIREIKKKYATYFSDKDFEVRNCIKIDLTPPISTHVINHILPFEIACDIEEMFWVD